MMKRITRLIAALSFGLVTLSCNKVMEEDINMLPSIPDGTPVTLRLGFGTDMMTSLDISTKAEATKTDETRVHDLYVFIFDNNNTSSGSPAKVYGRYFSNEHLMASLEELDASRHEGWFVKNRSFTGNEPSVGAVKVSTVSCSDATLIVLANVTNSVSSFNGEDDIAYLNGITNLDELRSTKVKLEQDVVNRKDLFLMMGELDNVNTAGMVWGTLPSDYDENYKVSLKTIDAKVRFLVRCNPENISAVNPVFWQVCSTPDRCWLFPDYNDGISPDDAVYFDSEEAYFEGTTTVDGYEWNVFTFYVLENRKEPKKAASVYHDREKQSKTDTGASGYSGPTDDTFADHFVKNGDWIYADHNSTYVKFDMVLTLTPAGIADIAERFGGSVTASQALTSDTVFSVHLGDFGSSESTSNLDDYNTLRGTYYTYKIVVNNTGSIYAEVENDNERQPGQEGFLLLTNDKIINADAHYESHNISFVYNPKLDKELFSWYVKTPFGQGEPTKTADPDNPDAYIYNAEGLDYRWVKFAVNEKDGNSYSEKRRSYPGDSSYDESWKPSKGIFEENQLLDINQLIEYIFDQTEKKKNGQDNDFLDNKINVTAFIDEFYYEENPLSPGSGADPDLWRKFVNASPREMHILSDARSSRDKGSDVIMSSHSIIQQSIQTIYNIYDPELRSLWGSEHKDENKEKVPDGWTYWPGGGLGSSRAGADNEIGRENGRLNTGYIWGTYSTTNASGRDINTVSWEEITDFSVDNDTPELKENYRGMAWSCLTRNRDNNGNGKIDREEVRWYLASSRQLIGLWVGKESISPSARLYQPAPGQWRAHVVSSTNRFVCWSEEGAGATLITHDWEANTDYHTWANEQEATKGESVRCLRNIGTYDEDGKVKDVSEAPYKFEVDKYFTVENNGDNSYTFHFNRLDTKSIREYSEGELPYHEHTSPTNRVYVKMKTQSRDDDVDAFSVQTKDINPQVTSLGHNPYCPEGYRFPNQTEWLLMSLYLPNDYLKKDKDGNNYDPKDPRMTTRTYYDRGYYGSLKQESGPWSTEKNKVGWIYSDKLHCASANDIVVRSRCVRDDDMTGNISGTISLSELNFYPEEEQTLKFNFTSTASAFTAASLKLCYTAHNGNYREVDIPVQESPTGLQYRKDQTISIPSLAELGLETSDLPVDMTMQAQIRNVAGMSYTYDLDLKLASHIETAIVDFPKGYDEQNGLPIHVDMHLGGKNARFASAIIQWKEEGGEWIDHPLNVDTESALSFSEDIYTRTLTGDDFVGKRCSYRLVVNCSDGTSYTSPVRSMEILRFNYNPNPEPEGGWTNISQCSVTWQDKISGVNFSEGDYIEAEMDLTQCRYVYISGGNGNSDIGKDNIFGFSTSNIKEITNSIIWYYPSVENLTPNPAEQGNKILRIHAGKWAALEEAGELTHMNLILDKDGILRDGSRFTGNPGDWNSRVKAALTGSSTIYIGSMEGVHHSRAIYKYVRVVRER